MSLPFILLGALVLIGALCVLGLVSDLRSGASRLAHEDEDMRRDVLPMNFWLGVSSKGLGAATALVLSLAVIHWLM